MPIYEYTCEPCGRSVERRRNINDRGKPVKCANCKKPMIRRLGYFQRTAGKWRDD